MEFSHLCLHPLKSSIGQSARESGSLLEENTDYQVSLLKNKLHWRKGNCVCVCTRVYAGVFFITAFLNKVHIRNPTKSFV